jgi:hypothetical protein
MKNRLKKEAYHPISPEKRSKWSTTKAKVLLLSIEPIFIYIKLGPEKQENYGVFSWFFPQFVRFLRLQPCL